MWFTDVPSMIICEIFSYNSKFYILSIGRIYYDHCMQLSQFDIAIENILSFVATCLVNENRTRRTMLFPLSVSWWMILRMIMFCWFVLINTVCWRLRRQAFMCKKINTFDILISLSLSLLLSALILSFLTLRVNYNV